MKNMVRYIIFSQCFSAYAQSAFKEPYPAEEAKAPWRVQKPCKPSVAKNLLKEGQDMKKRFSIRLLSLLLVFSLFTGLLVPVSATETNSQSVKFEKVDNSAVSAFIPKAIDDDEAGTEVGSSSYQYADDENVRVSIILEDESTIEKFGSVDIADDSVALNYREKLKNNQASVTAAIEKRLNDNIDVVWNLTLAANIISANVRFDQIETIEKVKGVKAVVIETRYEPMVVDTNEADDPNMATSSAQIGSGAAWAAGYTGAGSRIAVIDTGIDTDHQSFSAAGYEYSLAYRAGVAGKTVEEYKADLNLLGVDEIAKVWNELNASTRGSYTADQVYINSKIPYGFNYVDKGLDVTHDNDSQGEHGSHVEGIAAANAYIPNGDGTFSNALDTVKVQGVAPDAQIITMKVFGKGGGAYDSDYMAAIEDAVILGADSVNLSLGSGNPGMSRNSTAEYQAIMESLIECGTVVSMSAGNSGSWVENANNAGYLYSDDVSMDTAGSPGSYTNSLSVASVDNDGFTGNYISVDGNSVFYTETSGYKNEPISTIAGEQGYILIDGYGTAEEWAAVGEALEGKVAVCSRGSISFYQKGDFAAEAGAIATIIYNNTTGTINMDLSDYKHNAPCVSITQADGDVMRANATPVTDDEGNVLYYEGTLTVNEGISSVVYGSEYYTMSEFSSWGVPGSLELKPEIAAPGGNIYSVNGAVAGGTAYESMSGTSMAAPQVAGMAAVVAQYIRENGLEEKTGLDARTLAQSLLMSTAVPMREEASSGQYYPVLRQGAGLANVGNAVSAASYILMDEDATASAVDGKVKAELGDDSARDGEYSFSFSVNNITEEPQEYTFSTDLFTQDVFTYVVNNEGDLGDYMDTWTTPLSADVTYTVNGETFVPTTELDNDVDMDGDTDVDDAQAIIDYIVGNDVESFNADAADVDGDGEITSYDAYLILSSLEVEAVEVPAGESIDVTVTITLTGKDYIDANYPTGAYVEGYVYVKPVNTEDGEMGVTHSIPVLGFYGNWTDASMFDVGTRPERAAGDEVRIPYLGNVNANTFAITYAGDSSAYYFGGNPLVPDDTYMPERNAINSENGDQISKANFIAIRNAAASRFLAVNETTDKTLVEAYPGAVSSAYYYTNGGTWQNTGYTLNTKFVPYGAAEDDKLKLSLTLAPEYYVDAEGNVDWDALGEGASLTVPMVVDNTAPVLEDVSVSLTGNTMTVKASDNQYVAAVALYNNAGTTAYTYTGAKQDIQPGETADYTLDLTGVNGKKFLLQVFDYAMNATTYKVEMQIGEEVPLPDMIAFDLDNNFWTSFTTSTEHTEIAAYSNTDKTFFAATIVDHIVFASTDEGDLYVMPEDDLSDETLVANLGVVVTDMAYNEADGKIYGVSSGDLVTIDKLTGEVGVVGEIGILTNTLACDANGTFYCNKYGSGEIYSFTLDTIAEPKLVVKTNLSTSSYVQAMEINPNNGLLYWNSYYLVSFWGFTFGYSYLYEIDTAGTYTRYNDLWDELSCLIIPAKTSGGSWTTPTDKVSGIQISDDNLALLRGNSKQLTATVQPWTASDRTVTWTSADEAIAKVDSNGIVTGVSDGTTVITATSNLDPSYTAECTVEVSSLDVTLKGVLQDKDGNPMFFTWNLKKDTTWTPGTALDTNINSATLDPVNNYLYVMDAVADTWAMHKVDPTTGESVETAENAAEVPLWDMEYSQVFSTEEDVKIGSVYYTYFLSPKDPMNLDAYAFNLSSRLSSAGASYLVAVASLGAETIDYDGDFYDTERFVLLDNAGNLWNWWTYSEDDSYSAILQLYTSNLNEEFPGYNDDMYCSMVAGDDGALYLSAFDGNTNKLYYITIDDESATAEATLLGDVGDTVWPAALYAVESNKTADGGDAVKTVVNAEKLDAVMVTAEEFEAAAEAFTENAGIANSSTKVVDNSKKDASTNAAVNTGKSAPVAGFLNATNVKSTKETVRPTSVKTDNAVAADDTTVTITISEDVDVTNGKYVVEYDPAVLTYIDKSAVSSTQVHAFNVDETTGTITFAFASADAVAADSTLATIKFTYENYVNTEITITTEERNDELPPVGEEPVVITVEAESGEHDWVEIKRVEPTCTEDGSVTYECSKCGETKTVVIEALGHDYVEIERVEATCTEKGYIVYKCTRCGDTYKDVIPTSEGHDYVEIKRVDPTCIDDGFIKYECSKCGDTYKEVLEALGHNFVTEAGFAGLTNSRVVCTRCGLVISGGSPLPVFNPITRPILNPSKPTTPVVPPKDEEKPVEEPVEEPIGDPVAPVQKEFPFVDVSVDDWYYTAVEYLYNEGIMNGTSETEFSPDKELNRATVVTILYRMEGEPEVTTEGTFSDVPAGEWYSAAVEWAASVGIVTGYEDGTFAPLKAVTRQELSAILYRYAQYNGVTIYETTTELSTDAVVADWAAESVTWAVSEGLLVDGENVNATEVATRAEVAAAVYTYITKTAK